MTAPRAALDPDVLLSHAAGLRALARSLLGDAHLAEDVVQDAMLAAVRRPPEHAPLGPWLVVVVRNMARMARRGGARRDARAERSETKPGYHGEHRSAASPRTPRKWI